MTWMKAVVPLSQAEMERRRLVRARQPGRRRTVVGKYCRARRQTGPHPVRQGSGAGRQEPGASPGARTQRLRAPVISFRAAAVTLYTSGSSLLGNLTGGNTASNFPSLASAAFIHRGDHDGYI